MNQLERVLMVYINGIVEEETNLAKIDNYNSYLFAFDDFIEKVRERENYEGISLYCFLGKTIEIHEIAKKIKKQIKEMMEQFIKTEQIIKINLKNSNRIEVFIQQYLAHIFQANMIYFPMMQEYELEDDISCLCCYGIEQSNDRIDEKVDAIIDVFLEKESPFWYGKQVMIKSFWLKSIQDRRMIATLPEIQSGRWYALLEGGYKVFLETPYGAEIEKISYRDFMQHTAISVNDIVHQIGYAYGKIFYPELLFDEWNNAFLYALASLPIEYEEKDIKRLLEDFNQFIYENICESVEAEPIISKEEMIKTTCMNIEHVRSYLKGLEEEGISKNVLKNMNVRYCYLPILYEIIAKYYPDEVEKRYISEKIDIKQWENLINTLDNGNNYEKGRKLEDLAYYFLQSIEGIIVSGRNIKTYNQELDICSYNVSEDGFLWELGSIILVECKNWEEPVETKEVRNLMYIMQNKGVNTMLLFAKKSVTEGAKKEILKQMIYQKYIIVIDEKDLLEVLDGEKPYNILRKKWKEYEEKEGKNI